MGKLGHDARPITRFGIGADRAPVFEIFENGKPSLDDGVARQIVDIGVKADATGVMIVRGMVQPLRGGKALRGGRFNILGMPTCHVCSLQPEAFQFDEACRARQASSVCAPVLR